MRAQKQHRVASYNSGCRCTHCGEANRSASRGRRRRVYRARERREGDVMCVSCCCWFHPKGVVRHEAVCQG